MASTSLKSSAAPTPFRGPTILPAPLRGAAASFPAVPTLLATRLQLELLVAERSIDLNAAAGVILNDLGATLEIFRRAGEEGASAHRLEDCLASLGTETWMEAVCGNALERIAAENGRMAELTAFWEHARLLAYACWFVASHVEGAAPEEAYLVGLLHEVEALPALLGWETAVAGERDRSDISPIDSGTSPIHCNSGPSGRCTQHAASSRTYTAGRVANAAAASAEELVSHWCLPEYLCGVLTTAKPSARWLAVLNMAHAWSRGEDCLLGYTA